MSWHELAKGALDSHESFMKYFPQLPKRVRSLVKCLDERFSNSHMIEQIKQVSKYDQQLIKALAEIHKTFPLSTRFPTPEHENKYGQFSKAPKEIEKDLFTLY
ncbi:MAG: hypothetical protein AABZ60_04790 [Planctomycetota bacterium]